MQDKTKDFLKTELQKILERWSDSEYVKDLHDHKIKTIVCALLENQKLINESYSVSLDLNKLIPLVREVYANLLVSKIASCQPMLGPVGLIYYYDNIRANVSSEDVATHTKKLDLNLGVDFGVKDRAVDIVNEIDKEVLEDLSNNCGTVGSINLSNAHYPLAALREGISGAFEYFKYKNTERRSVKWMVVNENVFNSYEEAFSWKDVKVHINNNVKGILYGYKKRVSDLYDVDDTGYVYSPYVPFTYTPLKEKGRFSLLTRYGKKLLRGGSDYYGRITII